MKLPLLILSVTVLTGCSNLANPAAQGRAAVVVGNLYASHFEANELNTGGRAKIDAMRGNGSAVLVIHLTRATDRQVFVRRARDVKAYLKQCGLAGAQVRFDAEYKDAETDTFDPVGATIACVADDNR